MACEGGFRRLGWTFAKGLAMIEARVLQEIDGMGNGREKVKLLSEGLSYLSV